MFSKKPDPAARPTPSGKPMGSSNSTFSVIGSDVTIKGDISATTELHVDGRIEGDIACSSLVQGESSHIDGGIEAETARLAGTVSGSITARELVVLKSANIKGDVNYDSLTIEQGAEVEGRFAHRVPGTQQKAPSAAAGTRDKAGKAEEEPKLTLAN